MLLRFKLVECRMYLNLDSDGLAIHLFQSFALMESSLEILWRWKNFKNV